MKTEIFSRRWECARLPGERSGRPMTSRTRRRWRCSVRFLAARLGRSEDVIGRTIHLDGVAFTVIGVADPEVHQPDAGKSVRRVAAVRGGRANGFGISRARKIPGAWWVVMLGRLRDGVTIGQAQSAMQVLFQNEMFHGEQPSSTRRISRS